MSSINDIIARYSKVIQVPILGGPGENVIRGVVYPNKHFV